MLFSRHVGSSSLPGEVRRDDGKRHRIFTDALVTALRSGLGERSTYVDFCKHSPSLYGSVPDTLLSLEEEGFTSLVSSSLNDFYRQKVRSFPSLTSKYFTQYLFRILTHSVIDCISSISVLISAAYPLYYPVFRRFPSSSIMKSSFVLSVWILRS